MKNEERMSRAELQAMSYDDLQRMLAGVLDELLDIQEQLPEVAGEYQRLRSTERVLLGVKSILQSLLRAQRDAL